MVSIKTDPTSPGEDRSHAVGNAIPARDLHAVDDPLERIRLLSGQLAPSLQRVAAVVARDPAATAYLSGPGLARRADVSQPTVGRFAQAIGYAGYPDFLRALRSWVMSRPTVEKLVTTNDHRSVPIWRRVMEADMANIAQTIAEFDIHQFDRAVDMITHSRRVYIWGTRTTTSVSTYLVSSLSYLYETERIIQLAPIMYHEQLLTSDAHDVVLVVSFPRYANLSIEAARYARSRGARIIALTDSAVSPVAAEADCVLFAHSELPSFTESFVAPMSVAQALVAALAVADRKATVKRLQSLEDEWREHGVYHLQYPASATQRFPRSE